MHQTAGESAHSITHTPDTGEEGTMETTYRLYRIVRVANPHIPAWRAVQSARAWIERGNAAAVIAEDVRTK